MQGDAEWEKGGKDDLSSVWCFSSSSPERGSNASNSLCLGTLTHHRNWQYPVYLAFSCSHYCSHPVLTYSSHCCQSELPGSHICGSTAYIFPWFPTFKTDSKLLSMARQSLLYSNSCSLAVWWPHPSLYSVSVFKWYFQPVLTAWNALFSASLYLADSYLSLVGPPDKANPSLRPLSFLLHVLYSWHQVLCVFALCICLSIISPQGLSILPGRSWMLNLC